jgi:hypothetical protein
MKVVVQDLLESVQVAESLAQFDRPIDKRLEVELASSGLRGAHLRASGCLGWIWRHWLMGASSSEISRRVEPFVARGLELRERSRSYEMLPLHDLLLLNCAIFGSNDAQLRKVAEHVADSSGDKGEHPLDNGELHAAAWCGMLKYRILCQEVQAAKESELIWGARRNEGVTTATKVLVAPWVKRDWQAFRRAQLKDFEKWWTRIRKDGGTIKCQNEHEIVVSTYDFYIESYWCWSHCGLALLAYREGVEVITDALWLPPNALAAVKAL